MAYRSKVVDDYFYNEGNLYQIPKVCSIEIRDYRTSGIIRPWCIKGCGLNEAYFKSLEEIYELFGGKWPPITLDHQCNELVLGCLQDLNFRPPA